MLAADPAIELLTGPDDPVVQVAAPVTTAAVAEPNQAPAAPASADVDSFFAADFGDEPGSFIEAAAAIDPHGVDQLFAEVDPLEEGPLVELNTHDDPQENRELAQPANASSQASSVADFSWPAATAVGENTDQTTAQISADTPDTSSTFTDQSADPIRGPPGATGGENSLFSSDFLNSVTSDPADVAASAPRQLVVIDPLLDDIGVLASEISGPNIDLLTLAGDTDPLAQIEAALGQSGRVSAVHIFSHGSAGQFTLGNLRIDQDLVSARADTFVHWRELLTDDASLFVYGCNLAETAVGRSLIDQLAELTGAHVAASTDLTGNPLLGGDWQLEYQTGLSGAAGSLALPTYLGLLDDVSPVMAIISTTVNLGVTSNDASIALTFTSDKATIDFSAADITVSYGAISKFYCGI